VPATGATVVAAGSTGAPGTVGTVVAAVVVVNASKDPSPPWSLPRSASTRSPGRSKRNARLTS
jgi:hypothetical protein